MGLVAAAKDGVVLDVSEAEDVVEAGLIGDVEIADDGGGDRLPEGCAAAEITTMRIVTAAAK